MEPNEVDVGGVKFKVSPLNFATLKKIQPMLGILSQVTSETRVPSMEMMQAVTEVVYLALVRLNPDVTKEQIDDLITVDNVANVIDKIFNVSGVKLSGGAVAVL